MERSKGYLEYKQTMEKKVSVCVVTSPAVSHPSTELLDEVIASLDVVSGLERANVTIVFDGCTVRPLNEVKKGRVTADMAANYAMYKQRVRAKYAYSGSGSDSGSNSGCAAETIIADVGAHVEVAELGTGTGVGAATGAAVGRCFNFIECEEHQGFAFAVRRAVEVCGTPFCLVLQHDRSFVHDIPGGLASVVHWVENLERPAFKPIRYVGFPTNTSNTHDMILDTQYGALGATLRPAAIHLPLSPPLPLPLPLPPSSSLAPGVCSMVATKEAAEAAQLLHPLIFLYDSNHLAHCTEYLKVRRHKYVFVCTHTRPT
jgi:hypothetical protein